MAVTIKSILRKNTWTGEEVGRALILNLIYSWKEQLAGHGRLRTLFAPGQFSMMVNSLQGLDIDIYNNYVGLNNWIITNKTQANGFYLQAEAGIKKLFGILTTAAAGETVYKYIEKIPLIVTESQYERLTAENRERVFSTWGDVDLFSLMWDAIEHYMGELEDNPKAKNPLQAVKKQYEAEPVQSSIIIENHSILANKGYWQLEDGTRSDQVTDTEWLIASLKPEYRAKVQGLLERPGCVFDENTEELHVRDEMHELYKIFAEAMFKEDAAEEELTEQGRSSEDIEKALAGVDSEYRLPREWHPSTEPTEELTKWEILSHPQELNEYYFTLHSKRAGAEPDKKEYLAEVKDFVAEFPELVKKLLADITKATGRDVTKLKLEQWQRTCWTVKELYDKNIYGYRQTVDNRHNIFNGDERASFAGVAVIKEAGYAMEKSPDGDYIPPSTNNPLAGSMIGLEQYIDTNPFYEKNIDNLRECRDNILQGYHNVLIYDTACEMIANYTKLKEFTIFKQGAGEIEEEIQAINSYVPILYLSISKTNYGDKENQRKKLKVLREQFAPLDTSTMAIREKDYKEAWELLTKDYMEVFARNTQQFFNTLGGWGNEYKQQ